jgi:DNA-binding MarR family transcriptional regulator
VANTPSSRLSPAPSTRAQEGEGEDKGYVIEDQTGHRRRRPPPRPTAIFLAELGERFEITPTQYAALVKLHDLGAQSQNQLGRLTAMDPATIQGVIKRLQERSLIERSGDPADKRRMTLRLSASGAKLVAAMIPYGLRISAVTLEPLDAEERKALLALLRRLA